MKLEKLGKILMEILKFSLAKTADFGEFYKAVGGFPS